LLPIFFAILANKPFKRKVFNIRKIRRHKLNSKALFAMLSVIVFSAGFPTILANAQTMSGMAINSSIPQMTVHAMSQMLPNEAMVKEQTMITLSGEKSSDPNNEAITYQWQQMSGETVTLSSLTTEEITFMTPAVAAGDVKVLKFALTVTDPHGATSITSFTLDVTHINHPPVVTTDHELTVMEGSPVTLMATATDPDNDAMTYMWTQNSGKAITLSNPTALTTMFTAPMVGSDNNATLNLTITADDGHSGTGSDSVIVHVLPSSTYKIANLNCGPILRSHEGASAKLVEYLDNQSNDTFTYQWEQKSGIPLAISSTTDFTPTVSIPLGSGGSVFDFELTVSKNGTIIGNCEQYVYAAYPEPGNPPHADAGPDTVVNGGDQITLDGTNSTGAYLKFSWMQVAGEPVALQFANTAKPVFTAPDVAIGETKELTFSNTVTNTFGKDSAVVHILVVHPNLPPNAVIILK
jgi:hypothetical protein